MPILLPSPRRYPGGVDRWSFGRMVRNQEPLVLAGIALVVGLLAWKVSAS